MTTYLMFPDNVRDISADVIGADGRMQILPASYWAGTTPQERALFGHRHGLYLFPTIELVDYLAEVIGNRSAIEIGAGNGVLAEALGITATDNWMQVKEPWATIYAATMQPPVKYGPNVIDRDAHEAVKLYRPDVTIGCWVTHKYDPARHDAGGNEVGVDEEWIIRRTRRYIVIGNEHVHAGKAIWSRPHDIEYPSFVYSRAQNGTRDFIATWRR